MSVADISGREGVEIREERVWDQLWGVPSVEGEPAEGSERNRQRSRRKTQRVCCQQKQLRVPVPEGMTVHRVGCFREIRQDQMRTEDSPLGFGHGATVHFGGCLQI